MTGIVQIAAGRIRRICRIRRIRRIRPHSRCVAANGKTNESAAVSIAVARRRSRIAVATATAGVTAPAATAAGITTPAATATAAAAAASISIALIYPDITVTIAADALRTAAEAVTAIIETRIIHIAHIGISFLLRYLR